jgi:hypothetical protein
MYDNFKILNYSNSLVSPELFARHQSRLLSGDVADGLTVVPKTGLTVTVQTGNGLIRYGSGATASARLFSLVADFDIALDTADASNPRLDLIVIYVDTAVSLPGGTPTGANLDGPGVVKATFVKGTPNASPVAPTVGAIQTKIGAANPYIVVSEVRVDNVVTTIASNKITDRRTLLGPSASVAASIPASSITNAMLSTAAGQIGAAWSPFTPTLSSGTGAFNNAYAPNCYYKQVGKIVHATYQVNITTNGTAGSSVVLTLPVPANIAGGRRFIGYGREDAVTGKMLQGTIKTTSNSISILDYANNYPGADAALLALSITYEAA